MTENVPPSGVLPDGPLAPSLRATVTLVTWIQQHLRAQKLGRDPQELRRHDDGLGKVESRREELFILACLPR